MVEILKNGMVKMVIRMMINEEEVETIRNASMSLEVGVLIEIARATIHLGEHLL